MVPEVFGIRSGTDPVPVLKPDFGGIGGEKLLYRPRDDWDCRRSTEERHGWSHYRPKTATVRETYVGGDTPGLPNWIRKERQVFEVPLHGAFYLPLQDQKKTDRF